MAEETKVQQEEVELSKKAEEVIKTIEGLSVLELANLVKALEKRFGVTAAAPVMMAAGAAQAGIQAAGTPVEEKSTFNVVLAEVGANKIQVIKEIRALTNLGLKEAKDLVESAPKPIKEGATKEEADAIKAKLEAVGAKIELK